MIPFEGDLRLNSAMTPVEAGWTKDIDKEWQARAKKPCFSSWAVVVRALQAATSCLLVAMIWSNMLILIHYKFLESLESTTTF